jgi:peptidylprolyl isomerase domain and WD repeat-containing protein 1
MEHSEAKEVSVIDILGENLPHSDLYERSYVHKELLTFILVAVKKDLVFTFSDEGVIKFWKKQYHLIEYVKTFKAHLGLITCARLNDLQDKMYTTSPVDKSIKVFDLDTYDMVNIIKLDTPLISFCPTSSADIAGQFIGCDKEGSLYRIDQTSHVVTGFQKVVDLGWVDSHSLLITVNSEGYIEYLDIETLQFVSKEKNRVI